MFRVVNEQWVRSDHDGERPRDHGEGPRRVHVVTESANGFDEGYLIGRLAWHWQRAGHDVSYGPLAHIGDQIDVAILHVDRTRVAAEVVPDNPLQRPILNGRILDISKRLYSTMRVVPGDEWSGPVIVKSNFNYFGVPETRGTRQGFLARQRRWLSRKSWRLAGTLPPKSYPVLESMADVPAWVWRNPDLLVERFIPERDGDLYCLRGWVFFGNRGYTYRLFSTDKLVKVASIVRAEFLGDPPPELEAFRLEHGWDFGKFDFVMHDGRAILLDANKTPFIATGPDTPRLRHLAAGLTEIPIAR